MCKICLRFEKMKRKLGYSVWLDFVSLIRLQNWLIANKRICKMVIKYLTQLAFLLTIRYEYLLQCVFYWWFLPHYNLITGIQEILTNLFSPPIVFIYFVPYSIKILFKYFFCIILTVLSTEGGYSKIRLFLFTTQYSVPTLVCVFVKKSDFFIKYKNMNKKMSKEKYWNLSLITHYVIKSSEHLT